MKNAIHTSAALIALECLLAGPATGTTYYVSPTGNGNGLTADTPGEIIKITRQLQNGDVVRFLPGNYKLDHTKVPSPQNAYMRIPDGASNLTFIGPSDNPNDAHLVGTTNHVMRLFYFPTGGHVIRNLRMSGGYTLYQGAGVCMADSFVGKHEQAFTISNCVVENCSALYMGAGGRGGVWRDCVIRGNTVRGTGTGGNEGSGGGVFNATLYNCVITNNTSGYCGGGIAGGSSNGAKDGSPCPTKAYNCLIGWNTSANGGGAGESANMPSRDRCQLFGCTVISNTAKCRIAGVYGQGGGGYACVFSNCVIRGNSSLRATNDDGNGNTGGGGMRYCNAYDSLIENNRSIMGGAGASNSRLYRCRLVNNKATGSGGNDGYGGATFACAPVEDCWIAGNTARYGGAGFNGDFHRCVMTNNQATVYDGGATYNATSHNCIVVGNYARRYYAHCRGAHYGDLVYANRQDGGGGAVSGIGQDEGNNGEPLPVVNCTVWGNSGGSAQVSRASMTNTITQSVQLLHTASHSFWRATVGTAPASQNCIVGTDKDPLFVDLQTNSTVTASTPAASFALRLGSPCRDKGTTLAGQSAETDALGNPRVKFDGVDMGALECCLPLGTWFMVR